MDISTQIGGYKVFYTELETDESTNKISSKVRSKIIPVHLKEQFLERYGRKVKDMTITGQEIDHFLEKNLFEDFNKLVDAFLQISCNTNRKNFLNSQYVLKQLLRRYNYHVKDDDLCMLKTPARIREHDEIYEKCCELLNWNYQPL
jgi:hypothetical protein